MDTNNESSIDSYNDIEETVEILRINNCHRYN